VSQDRRDPYKLGEFIDRGSFIYYWGRLHAQKYAWIRALSHDVIHFSFIKNLIVARVGDYQSNDCKTSANDMNVFTKDTIIYVDSARIIMEKCKMYGIRI